MIRSTRLKIVNEEQNHAPRCTTGNACHKTNLGSYVLGYITLDRNIPSILATASNHRESLSPRNLERYFTPIQKYVISDFANEARSQLCIIVVVKQTGVIYVVFMHTAEMKHFTGKRQNIPARAKFAISRTGLVDRNSIRCLDI